MAKYGKRPLVKRFRLKKTRPGRDIKKTTLERKERKRPGRKGRQMRTQRSLVR